MRKAILEVERGEEIVAALISGHIAGTGHYKLLAKRRKDGTIEWAHFTERDNGLKENVYRGEVNTDEELQQVMGIMNKHLVRVFGEEALMRGGELRVGG